MGLIKLTLAPDQAGYQVTDGTEVVSTALDGGAARYRKDIARASAAVNVQWRLNPIEFRYLKTFFTLLVDKGSKAFLLDMYIDREELTEHACHFVPGSFRLIGQRGKQFTVSAQLEATPTKLTDEEETEQVDWATLFGELGEDFETLFPPIECDIDQIITFDLSELVPLHPPPYGWEEFGAQWLDNYNGDGTWSDKVTPRLDSPTNVGVPCIELDGTNSSVIESGVERPDGDWHLELYLNPTLSKSFDEIFGSGVDALFLGFVGATGALSTRIGGVRLSTTAAIPFGEWSRVISKRVSGDITLEAYGLDGTLRFSELVGNNTNTPSAGTIKIGGTTAGRHYDGQMALVCFDECFCYPMTEQLPYDVNVTNGVPTGNHAISSTATESTTEGILNYMGRYGYTEDTGKYIPGLIDLVNGERLDARDNLPIGVRGSIDGALVLNSSPPGMRQTDGRIIDNLRVSGTGTIADSYEYEFNAVINGKVSHAVQGGAGTLWDSTNWLLFDGSETWTHPTATGPLPPKSWPDVGSQGSPAPTIEYGPDGSFWVDADGEFTDVYYTDYEGHTNGTYGVWVQWEEVNGVFVVKEQFAYLADLVFPNSVAYNQTLRWAQQLTTGGGNGVVPFDPLDKLITVSSTGTTADDLYTKYGESEGRGTYQDAGENNNMYWTSGSWYLLNFATGEIWQFVSTDLLPPKTDWPVGSAFGTPAPTLGF